MSDDESTSSAVTDAPGSFALDRRAWLVLGLVVLGLLASLVWLVHPWYDPTNDGAMYLLTARSILAGEGYSMLGEPFVIRPPGFAYLIAPLVAWKSASPYFAIHLFVSLWGVAGCALLFVWTRARLGTWLAALVAVALWLNPGYQLLCNQTMSDVPGGALLVVCLLMERWAERAPAGRRPRRELMLGIAIGLFALVRSQIVLLAPAIVAMRLVRRLWPPRDAGDPGTFPAFAKHAAVLALGVALVQAPWGVRNSLSAGEPPADQTRLYSYSTGFWNEDMGDPSSRRLSFGEVLGRAPLRGGQMLGVLADRMTGGGTGTLPVAVFFLGCTLYVALKRRASSELFVLGSSALVSVYFGFAPRLLLPIYMLALPAAVETVRDLAAGLLRLGRVRSPRPAGWIAAALLGGLVFVDFEPRRRWREIELGHRQLEAITERFASRLEDDAVVASNRAWHYAVFLERPVYALEFVVLRTGRPEDVEALMDKYGVNTVLLSPAIPKDREVLPYFEARYGAQTDPLAHVYRVR